jgi:hypothetical protein
MINFLYYKKLSMVLIHCSLKIVNASYNDNLYQINYIPFSISTIKLLIQNEEYYDVDVLIKPTKFQNNDDFCGGFDDEKNGLKIIWGGGQENGLQTIVKGTEKRYLFLFVFPTENFNILTYNLTLQVNKTIVGSNTENILEEISIKLYPIATGQLIHNIAHQKIVNNSENTRITFDGNLVNSYYPRWYPELFNLFVNTDNNYYHSEPGVSNISFTLFKKSQGFDQDRIVLDFKGNEIAVIEGDMDGASYHIDVFRYNNAFIVRLWFLWISKKQFIDRNNLKPLQTKGEKKGIFDKPELPDFERFDIVISSHGTILAVCTDFHWQEYWYKLRDDNTNMIGIVAKLFHPIDESLARLCNRNFVENKYENIIKDLQKIVSLSENLHSKFKLIYVEGKEIEDSIQNRQKMPIVRGKNFFRSHVPYVRNGYILSNMISHIVVDKYD